ncbi:DUF5054 domain-containing protein [Paenibacillus sp. KQZ6P-2]|uniref:DUF5054 domain-containing protein n=1 Tax=Paenibacillus mangrovi TaxID=2931978 RepID=A0A9X1WRD4_9BACL|nr:DUF5054 domain-containing protein [Paenibacillus mangrovi]MCJ8010279.1 DUF5054 domain-containing protein [Paenibacillus mangrovi]
MMNQKKRLEKIYVVFKTHFDIGFTGLVSDVVERYQTEMLKDVISICGKTAVNPEHEKYVWTMPAWPLRKTLDGSSQEDRDEAMSFVDSGQLIWHMLPYTTHTEFCGLEEWIRGMYISRGLSEQFGYIPKDAKMTDVPGHTWVVPSLLAKAGVKILHLGCNPASTPPDVPPVFFWEGPDGERLLTFYSKGSYGTGILPPEEWEHPVWLAMIQTSDNHGPHDPSYIQEMKDSLKASGLNTQLHIGSLTDFAEDFLARNPELPVIRGDLADSWIHGVGTAPREVSRVRELRGRIAGTESALAMAKLTGDTAVDIDQAKTYIDKSYEHALLFGEHTWGMDCKTFLFPRRYEKEQFLQDKETERYKKMEHSWQEQRDYLNTAEAALHSALELAGGVSVEEVDLKSRNGNVSDPADKGSKPAAYRIYNHLGWKRDAHVLLPYGWQLEPHERLIDCSTGELVQFYQNEAGVWADMHELPALGYKTLAIASNMLESGRKVALTEAAPAAEVPLASEAAEAVSCVRAEMNEREAVLENEYLIVKVSRWTGLLTSIWDKRLQQEFVNADAQYGFGQYEYNVYSSEDITRYIKKYAYRFYDWGIHDFGKTGYPDQQKRLSFTTDAPELQLVQEADAVCLVCITHGEEASLGEYGNAERIVWSVRLTGASPELDFELQLKGKEETPLAESGSLIFPLKLDQAKYRINKMGSVVDPIKDVVRSSSTLLNSCEYFVDVTDDQGNAGMAFVPLDSPLFFIGKNGMWDFEHQYTPEQPELHFNLFNNWWGTNFPQWTGGDLCYRYKLIPHAGSWSESEVWKRAEEAVTPVTAVPVWDRAAEAEPVVYELLPQELDGAAVTCFKPAEDGDGCILRLREWTGTSRELTVTLPAATHSVSRTDLLEHHLEELTLVDAGSNAKQITLFTNPFEVHTLRIRG